MKAILLARVSSKEQEEGQSIPAQERRLREYTERKGLIIEEVVKITESSTRETRKEFEKSPANRLLWSPIPSTECSAASRNQLF